MLGPVYYCATACGFESGKSPSPVTVNPMTDPGAAVARASPGTRTRRVPSRRCQGDRKPFGVTGFQAPVAVDGELDGFLSVGIGSGRPVPGPGQR